MIAIMFVLIVLAKICIGFFCANKMTSDNPLWVRLIVLGPALTGFYVLIEMLHGNYVAYLGDIYRTAAVIALYLLVASRFTNNPWLDIKTNKDDK
jgi:inner membrane protein involved in colicin E2 resistance